MVETIPRGPGRKSFGTELIKELLEPVDIFARIRVSRRDRTACTRITTLEIYNTNAEANDVALVLAEQLILPERRNTIDLKRGPKP